MQATSQNLVEITAYSGSQPHDKPVLKIVDPYARETLYVCGADPQVFAHHDGTGWGAVIDMPEPGAWSWEWLETGTEQPQRGEVLVMPVS